jgi:hypothetical protein
LAVDFGAQQAFGDVQSDWTCGCGGLGTAEPGVVAAWFAGDE